MATPKYVLALIEKANQEKAEFLDLGTCGLKEIPDEIKVLAPFLKRLNLGAHYKKEDEYVQTANRRFQNNLFETSATFLTLQSLSNLTILDLSDMGITDLDAAHIAKLTQLTVLDIRANQLMDEGAANIASLSQLISLDISYNKLSDEGAAHIAKLSKLNSLHISGNRLTGEGAAHIAKISQLNRLYISYNNLADEGAAHIAKLSRLNSLYIRSNQIKSEGAKHIANLSQLNSLYINDNQLTDEGAAYIAELSSVSCLDISSNELTDVGATFIARLSQLNSLNISSNELTDDGAAHIAKLSKLNTLDISGNQLTGEGAVYIAKLTKLIDLDISYNQLVGESAKYIAKLAQLNSLNIRSNQLMDEGAAHIAKLSQLNSLVISDNQLGGKGAAYIAKLSQLNSLDISENQLTEKDLKILILQLQKLINIVFDNNKMDGLPKEIGTGVEALRAYFRSDKLVDNTLVKMILIGNTTAGKTSLASFLSTNTYQKNNTSTEGIQLWRWNYNEFKDTLRVNIWDFGGQDYHHATHNLFLKSKALYLLLQTTKNVHNNATKEKKQYLPAGYWLGNIYSLAKGDAPIWFVQTKTDIPPPEYLYLDGSIRNKYGVERQFAISVQDAFENMKTANLKIKNNAFVYFRDCLVEKLKGLAKEKLPESWVTIRDEHLPRWQKDGIIHLTKEMFRSICEAALQNNLGLLDDFMKTRDQDNFEDYLDKCGEILWFKNNKRLDNIIFIHPKGLIDGIYRTLLKKETLDKGCFSMEHWVNEEKKRAELYLEVLLAFDLVFKKNGTENIYVAPQHLPENPLTMHFQQLLNVVYIIRYPDYMSRSLITRFLVKYASTPDADYYWRYGAFFKMKTLHVFVRIDADMQKIFVHIQEGSSSGRFKVMKELFLFFAEAEKLQAEEVTEKSFNQQEFGFDDNNNLRFKDLTEFVPPDIELSLNDKDFATVKEIREGLANKVYKIKSLQGSYIEFNATIHQLLNANATMPKKIFLSYSHRDELYKKELDTHFAALKRSGKVETWHDRKIEAGDDWDAVIKDALDDGDIFLLLLSPDFMASDYIWNIEIKAAKDKGATIVPIFLRPCDFEETFHNVKDFQGLPRDARWIVSSIFPHRDEGYLEVVQGIKALLV